MTGVTVMLNVSVTSRLSLTSTTSKDEKEDDEAEYRGENEEEESEEKADKVDEEEEEGRSNGATQARKVKLSLVVSESSWIYVMPNLFRVVWEKSGWILMEDENKKSHM